MAIDFADVLDATMKHYRRDLMLHLARPWGGWGMGFPLGAAPDWTTRLCENGFHDLGIALARIKLHEELVERARRLVIDMGVDPSELCECD